MLTTNQIKIQEPEVQILLWLILKPNSIGSYNTNYNETQVSKALKTIPADLESFYQYVKDTKLVEPPHLQRICSAEAKKLYPFMGILILASAMEMTACYIV